jgi:hypothetical protein
MLHTDFGEHTFQALRRALGRWRRASSSERRLVRARDPSGRAPVQLLPARAPPRLALAQALTPVRGQAQALAQAPAGLPELWPAPPRLRREVESPTISTTFSDVS